MSREAVRALLYALMPFVLGGAFLWGLTLSPQAARRVGRAFVVILAALLAVAVLASTPGPREALADHAEAALLLAQGVELIPLAISLCLLAASGWTVYAAWRLIRKGY